jgi:hypothetical protein
LEEWEDELLLATVMRVDGADAREAVPHKAANVCGLDKRRVPPDGVEPSDEYVVNEGHVGSEEALDIAFKGLEEGRGGESRNKCPGFCVRGHFYGGGEI